MIYAIILAAGRSRRMGAQKLLLPLARKPVITRIVDELQKSPLLKLLVVVGRDGERIKAALRGRSVSFLTNPDAAGDMLSSIRCGLRAMPARCSAALIVLGDQPNVTARLVAKLVAARARSGSGIIVPTHRGHRGHPVLLAARFRDELMGNYNGVGLQGLLNAHLDEVFSVEIHDGTMLRDMDKPEDYQRELASNAA
jgi:molybdenum cofactor cytidylyltransferase